MAVTRFANTSSFTSASVPANGSAALIVTIEVGARYWDLVKAKLVPSVVGGTTTVGLYKKATCLAADVLWSATFSGSLLIDPMEDLGAGAGPTARNKAIIASGYDADSDFSEPGNLYLKISNNPVTGSVSRTYAVELAIEERARVDADGMHIFGEGAHYDDPVAVANFANDYMGNTPTDSGDMGGLYLHVGDPDYAAIASGAKFVEGDWLGRSTEDYISSFPGILEFDYGDLRFHSTHTDFEQDEVFTPAEAFHVDYRGRLQMRAHIANSALFTGYRENGTIASPTHLLSGDLMATFGGSGKTQSLTNGHIVQRGAAGFDVFAAENWTSDNNHGAYLSFFTTPVTTGADVERLRILATGDLAIASNKKFNFDGVTGAGDTYMLESSANVLDTYVGGANVMRANATGLGLGVTPAFPLHVGGSGFVGGMLQGTSGARFMLNATGSTSNFRVYDLESGSDVLKVRRLTDDGTGLNAVLLTIDGSGNGTFTGTTQATAVTATTAFRAADGSVGTPSYSATNYTSTGRYFAAGPLINEAIAGALKTQTSSDYFWTLSRLVIGGSGTVSLTEDAANVLGLKNGTTAQEFRVYGTTTGPKYLSMRHNGSSGFVGTNSGGGNTVLDANGISYFFVEAATGNFLPTVDNGLTFGDATHRASEAHVGGFVAVGTNPATDGSVRIEKQGAIAFRNEGNTADLYAVATNSSNEMLFSVGPITTTRFNSQLADQDFIIASDTSANHFVSDAGKFSGVGAFGFGTVADSAERSYISFDRPAITVPTNTDFFGYWFRNSNTTTIPAGTAGLAIGVNIDEPNFTATGTITSAATFRISGAPTEGASNYAEWIVAGAVRWGGYGAGTATFDANGNITSVSDERAKVIVGKFGAGLKELRKIDPIVYKWREGQNLETEHEYAGFGSQNVHNAIPIATGLNPDGMRTLQDRALLAAVVNAIKELDRRTARLETIKKKAA